MEPNNSENNGVWISREEYERLRQAKAAAPISQSPATALRPMFEPIESTPRQGRKIQILVGAALSLAVYFALTTGLPPTFALIVFGLTLLFIMFTLIEMIRGNSNDPALVGKGIKYGSIYKGIGLVMLITLGLPAIYFAGMIILLFVAIAFGGYRGS